MSLRTNAPYAIYEVTCSRCGHDLDTDDGTTWDCERCHLRFFDFDGWTPAESICDEYGEHDTAKCWHPGEEDGGAS